MAYPACEDSQGTSSQLNLSDLPDEVGMGYLVETLLAVNVLCCYCQPQHANPEPGKEGGPFPALLSPQP